MRVGLEEAPICGFRNVAPGSIRYQRGTRPNEVWETLAGLIAAEHSAYRVGFGISKLRKARLQQQYLVLVGAT
jgi:hypothetical protein